jgi:hypothetical protein
VTPQPGGVYGHVYEHGTVWAAVTVIPGTYRYALACSGGLGPLTWGTVEVPWGAVVRTPELCPPAGTLRGHVQLSCPSGAPVTCEAGPDIRHLIVLQFAQTGEASEVVTDGAGNFTILLPPGIYTVWPDRGYVVVTNPGVITVESGATVRVDVTFERS